MDSEDTLLTLIDERAQSVSAAPGITPEGGSVEGAPVLKLKEQSVLGKPLVGSLHVRMPVMELLQHEILATASVWEPLEHLHYVVSDHVNFDSFWMAPWDAGGMLGDCCQPYVTFWSVYMGLTDALTVGHYPDMNMMINTESPRLAVTPGEWYANPGCDRRGETRLQNSAGFSQD